MKKAELQAYASKRIAAVRVLFGLVWLVDAAFKFEPSFYNGILMAVQGADSGEPGWLNNWFGFWYSVIGANPHLFAIIIIIAETLTALALIFGVARRLNYILGAVLAFLIWSVAEGFGGPYVSGSTDIGAGFIYVIVYFALYAADGLVRPSWSLDPIIEKYVSWWHVIATPPNKVTESKKEPVSVFERVYAGVFYTVLTLAVAGTLAMPFMPMGKSGSMSLPATTGDMSSMSQ